MLQVRGITSSGAYLERPSDEFLVDDTPPVPTGPIIDFGSSAEDEDGDGTAQLDSGVRVAWPPFRDDESQVAAYLVGLATRPCDDQLHRTVPQSRAEARSWRNAGWIVRYEGDTEFAEAREGSDADATRDV